MTAGNKAVNVDGDQLYEQIDINGARYGFIVTDDEAPTFSRRDPNRVDGEVNRLGGNSMKWR